MLSYTTMGTYVLVVTLATVFVIILVARQQRAEKDLAIWFISGLVGILLGAAGAAAVVQTLGYDIVKSYSDPLEGDLGGDSEEGMDEGGGMGMGGMGGPGGGMGGPGGGMGGPGGGMGGGRGPSPKRQLTMLVRKVDLLTGDVAMNLTDEQGTALAEILGKIKSQETMTDEDATALNEEILAVFDEDQKAKQEAVGLPRGARGGRGGGPGGGGPGGGGPGGGGEQAEDANPFAEEQNAEALDALLGRLGGPAADAPAAETEPKEADPAETEAAETEAAETEAGEAAPEETTTDQPETPKE
ncbi:MAG: hypothetical protein H8E44_31345 [Planctomycetes bacterium]|nr:hypothetical protein [Planctomycetota bacterium]